jgi:hypothetical protein
MRIFVVAIIRKKLLQEASVLKIGSFTVTTELIISICAMFLTIYQAYLTRRHNKLSVQPHLARAITRTREPQKYIVSIKLRNDGLGPARITKLSFGLDNAAVNSDVFRLAKILFEGHFPYRVARNGLPGIGTLMPATAEIVIATVDFQIQPSDETVEQIEVLLNRTSLTVEYESLYDEKFKLS